MTPAFRPFERSVPAGASDTFTVDFKPDSWVVSTADVWTGRVACYPGPSVPGAAAFVLPSAGSANIPGLGEKVLSVRNDSSVAINLNVVAARDIPVGGISFLPSGATSVNVIYPSRATLFADEFRFTVGTLGVLLNGGQRYLHYIENVGGTNGATFEQSFELLAGSYTLSVLGSTDGFGGLLDWYIDDGIVVTGQDWYSAGATANVTKTAVVAVTGSGRHVLKGVVNGKNGASAGFRVLLTKIWFVPSADVVEVA